MYIKFCLTVLIAILQFNITQASTINITTPSEGIYRIQVPFAAGSKVLVYNKDYCYMTSTDDNGYGYIYGKSNQTYILEKTEDACSCIEQSEMPTKKIFDQRNKYRNSVAKHTENWFFGLTNSKNNFKFQHKSKSYVDVTKVDVILSNLSDQMNPLILTQNGKSSSIHLLKNEQKTIRLQVSPIHGEINITINSRYTVGINSIAISNANKTICNPSPNEVFYPPYRFTNFEKPVIWFYFTDNELVRKSQIDVNSSVAVCAVAEEDIPTINTSETKDLGKVNAPVVIVYHKTFTSEIHLLKDYFASLGLLTMAVDAQQIYNQHNKGSKSPAVIKKFIHDNKVDYCILVGDSSVDQRSPNDLLPSFIYYTKDRTRILSDHYYSYLSNPLKPTIRITRLPFKNVDDLRKHIKHNSNYSEFQAESNIVFDDEDILQNATCTRYISYSSSDISKVVNANSKQLNMYHLGHGTELFWENNLDKVRPEHFARIIKGYHLVDFSCWTGAFGLRKYDSLTESLLHLDTGAPLTIVASYGSLQLNKMSNLYSAFSKQKSDSQSSNVLNAKKELAKNYPELVDELFLINLFGVCK